MKCVSSVIDASLISYSPCPIPRKVSLRNACARFGSENTAASGNWSLGVTSRTPWQPVAPRRAKTAMAIRNSRFMAGSLLEHYGRAEVEHTLLRVVLTVRVPRLGIDDLEPVQQQEIVSVGVHPEIAQAETAGQARREVVSELDRLEPDVTRVAQEVGVRV